MHSTWRCNPGTGPSTVSRHQCRYKPPGAAASCPPPPTAAAAAKPRPAMVCKGSGSDVKAVLFDMDGVLCNSESLSRRSAAAVFKQLYNLDVQEEEFIPFGGMGENRFLGGVADKYSVQGFDVEKAKQLFFDIYINTYAKPESRIGYAGAVELVRACRAAGLKTAVASSAERVKVDANLAAAGFAEADFDAVVSASGFSAIKPAPDIFLAAARLTGITPAACVVVEDAPAGIQAARAAGMRVIGVTTTLSVQEMQQQAPDAVFPVIGSIHVADILATQYTQQPSTAAAAAGTAVTSS